MFDYVRSSYDLGEEFRGNCQTKDIERGYGGTMSQYWIDPSGRLYVMTYSGTHDFHIIEEGDPDYNKDLKLLNFKWIPTGTHGKVEPHYLSAYVEIYPESWRGQWENWPRLLLHFHEGVLQSHKDITNDPLL